VVWAWGGGGGGVWGGGVPFFSFMLKRRLMLARMPLPSVMVGVGDWMEGVVCGIYSGLERQLSGLNG
jgi:hypothetical protein